MTISVERSNDALRPKHWWTCYIAGTAGTRRRSFRSFVDYAKAFDHVDHNVDLQKLKSHGVPDFIVS